MHQYLRKVLRAKGEDGASAVEYGLLVAAIAAVIVIVIFALGGVIKNVFEKTCSSVATGASTTSSCS